MLYQSKHTHSHTQSHIEREGHMLVCPVTSIANTILLFEKNIIIETRVVGLIFIKLSTSLE